MSEITTNELTALRLLSGHAFSADRLKVDDTGHENTVPDGAFVALAGMTEPDAFARFGQALGAFHLEFKGKPLPGLELHDAAWFSRSAPYVLAEVASLADSGQYELTLPELGQLEEAGIVIAELSEPLTGLLPSFVHGNCTLETAGFIGDRPCLRDWHYATAGFSWLDVAALSRQTEDVSRDCLVALIASYADAADYPVGVLGDLVPFARAMQDVYILDRWNVELTSGIRASGSLKLQGEQRVRRLLELVVI
jgi:hypothetical protein